MRRTNAWHPPEDKVQALWADYTHLSLRPIKAASDVMKLLLVVGKLAACKATRKKPAPLPPINEGLEEEIRHAFMTGITGAGEAIRQMTAWKKLAKPESWKKEIGPLAQETIQVFHRLAYVRLAAGDRLRVVYSAAYAAESRLAVVWDAIQELNPIPPHEADMIHPDMRPRFWWLPGSHGPSKVSKEIKEMVEMSSVLLQIRKMCASNTGGTLKGRQELLEKLNVLLSVLPPIEGVVFRQLFVLNPPTSGEAVASMLGITRQRVHQIKVKAMVRLEAADWMTMLKPETPLPVVVKWATQQRSA